MLRRLLLTSLATVVSVCWTHAPAAAASDDPVLIKGHPVHPTRILARVAAASSVVDHAAALAASGLTVVRGSDLVPGLMVLDVEPPVAALATSVAATTAQADVSPGDVLLARIEALRATGKYHYVEPDYLVTADATPSDSYFTNGTLWGLRNTGQYGGVAGVDIGAVAAWDVTKGSASVIVAVIDTGVRYTHAELATQMWRNPGEVAGNGIDDDRNGHVDDVYGINAINGITNPIDDSGHGTLVAGIIGAAANNGQPVVGVAWQVRIMALKFLPDVGNGSTSDAITCIEYALANGANILNCSWGSGGDSHALRDAIAAAGAQGVLLVAACGNESADSEYFPHYPSGYDLENVISVAAIDRTGALASFSNYGRTSVDLGAPGVSIFSSGAGTDNTYLSGDGTSMAAPFVSGVAALVRARYPDISVSDLRARLLQTTVPTASLEWRTATGGRVNADRALTMTGDGQLELTASPSSGSVVYTGRNIPVIVRVADLVGVTGGTVSGVPTNGGTLQFRDNGVAPDATAGDANYTALWTTPSSAGSASIDVSASAPGKATASMQVSYVVNVPPANDMFAARSVLTGALTTLNTNNLGATTEPLEPHHAGDAGGASIWWTWTAPANCSVTVDTVGSTFDTILGVYTGEALGALTEIASNDDISGPSQPSRVTFDAIGGTTYQIAVDGFSGETGSITLNFSARIPPPNDNFAQRAIITGSSATLSGDSSNATLEPGEPVHRINTYAPNSVWWSWTAPENNTAALTLSMGSAQGYIAVYVGSSLGTLERVPLRGYDPQGQYTSRATFAAAAGTTYQIAIVREPNSGSGAGGFTLTLATAPSAAGDRFADRSSVTGESVAITSDNTNATRELGEPALVEYPMGATQWWEWTAPRDGTVVVAVAAQAFRPIVGAFTGDTLGSLTAVPGSPAKTDSNYQVEMAFHAVAGTRYQIVVDAFSGSVGGFTWTLGYAAAPWNDDFAQRRVVTGRSAAFGVDLRGATREAGEVLTHPHASGRSMWWRYVTPARGTLRVASSVANTTVGLFRGTSLGGLQPLAMTEQRSTAVAVAHVEAGEEIVIVLDGTYQFAGATSVAIELHDAPANDMFADRIAVSGDYLSLFADTTHATFEAGEPYVGVSGAVNTVWWSWTAPRTGVATFRTSGRGLFNYAGMFTGDSLGGLTGLAFLTASPRTVSVTAGVTYQIALTNSAYGPGPETFHLSLGAAPANDVFATRAVLAAEQAEGSADTVAAHGESGEFTIPGQSSNWNSVWWSWTAPRSGRVMASTEGSDYDTILAVATGPSVFSLTTLATNDDDPTGGTTSRVFFDAVAGTAYAIYVDGKMGAAGRARVNVRYQDPPANDHFAARTPLSGTSARADGSNLGATAEPSEPGSYHGAARASVWWTWTAPANAMAEFSTAGSGFDTILTVYAGDSLGQLVVIGSINNASDTELTSRLVTPVFAGRTYQIAVDGAGGSMGSIALAISTGSAPMMPSIGGGHQNVDAGTALELALSSGEQAGATCQWSLDGVDLPGATSSTLALRCAQAFQTGTYTVRVSNAFGSATSAGIQVSVTPRATSGARLLNLSTRALDLTGDNQLIPGFVISGTGTKRMLVRAIGPGLFDAFGLQGYLQNPQMWLKRGGVDIAANDDWGMSANKAEIIATSATVGAFPLLDGSEDAVILVDLPAGAYTAPTVGVSGGTGVAMVELYDADPGASSCQLVNISNRGFVDVGDKIMIPGFVVSSEGSRTFLIRAVGPGLYSTFGLQGELADPVLTVFSGPNMILSNDDWGAGSGAATTSSTAAIVGAFPLVTGSKDAAFVVTLPPGPYTVQATGKGGTTGVALVEVYLVP